MTALPSVLGTYHEPFVGGGALFFALTSRHLRFPDSKEESAWRVAAKPAVP